MFFYLCWILLFSGAGTGGDGQPPLPQSDGGLARVQAYNKYGLYVNKNASSAIEKRANEYDDLSTFWLGPGTLTIASLIMTRNFTKQYT